MVIEYIVIIWLLAVMSSVVGIAAHVTCRPALVRVAVATPAPVVALAVIPTPIETTPEPIFARTAGDTIISRWQCGKCNKSFTGERPIREGYGMRIETCDPCADKLVKALNSKWTVNHPKYSGRGYGYLGTDSRHYVGYGRDRDYEYKYSGTCPPMCGDVWIAEHSNGNTPDCYDQTLVITYDGAEVGQFNGNTRRGEIKSAMKQAVQLVIV